MLRRSLVMAVAAMAFVLAHAPAVLAEDAVPPASAPNAAPAEAAPSPDHPAVVKAKAKKRRRAGAGAPAESGLRLPGNKNLAQRHEICLAFIRRHNQSCDPWEQPTCGADIGYMRPLECVAP